MNLVFASDDLGYISWKYAAEEDVPILRHTNEVIRGYVTAGATIHLYRYLELLRKNGTYCDTECVICIQPSGGFPLIEKGGQRKVMTSELRSSESISGFMSGGPNDYAYRVLNTGDSRENTVSKFRGITLKYYASKLVNFNVIRDMIMGDEPPVVNVHTEHKIKRMRRGRNRRHSHRNSI